MVGLIPLQSLDSLEVVQLILLCAVVAYSVVAAGIRKWRTGSFLDPKLVSSGVRQISYFMIMTLGCVLAWSTIVLQEQLLVFPLVLVFVVVGLLHERWKVRD